MKRVLFLLAAMLICGPVIAQVRHCESQETAFNKANAAYEKENTPTKRFFKISSSARSIATANMKTALDALKACRDDQARDKQDAKDRAKEQADYAAYAATPEGKIRIARAKELNKVSNGRLDVASFTPRSVISAVLESGWIHLGESDQTSFWYAYWTDSPEQGTGVVLKSADKSIGDAYTIIKVMVGFADCRGAKSGNYPTYLMHASVEVDDASTGYPPPGYSDVPMLGAVPLQRGTALAEAVKQSCDRATVSR